MGEVQRHAGPDFHDVTGPSPGLPTLQEDPGVRHIGGLTLDAATRSILLDDREVLLTPREFGVLWLLSERPGRAVHRYELLDEIWGSTLFVDPGTLTVCVCRLRQKLEEATGEPCRFIRTVHNVGYRLVA